MTDITELAQRVKTEVSTIDDTQWYLAKPSEIRLLVEALEAKDKENAKLRSVIKASRKYVELLESQLKVEGSND
ncbi:TPA: hypothetical protein ACY3JH_002908 [Klebsiella aerogenes]